jgi:hypothetical protein
MAQWKDVTQFSQGDKERKPSVFKAKLGRFTVVVLNSHRDYPGVWVMHLEPDLIDTRPLAVAHSLEEAKIQALSVAEFIFSQALDEIID